MIDWNAEARRAVAHVESELSESHRGAFLWYEPMGVVLVFNNRPHEDPIPEKQMDFVKRAFDLKGGTIHSIALSDDQTTWALMATGIEPAWAFDCVWAAWHSALSETDPEQFTPLTLETFIAQGVLPLNIMGQYQYGLAQKTIEAHYSNPNTWKNCRPDGWTFGEPFEEPE